jgi:hypothetical protein
VEIRNSAEYGTLLVAITEPLGSVHPCQPPESPLLATMDDDISGYMGDKCPLLGHFAKASVV